MPFFPTIMAESYTESLRRRALRLVLEKNLPPGQVAKVLQCTSRAVRQWINEALDQESLHQADPSPFIPVTLDDTPPTSPTSSSVVSVEALSPNGYGVQLQLASLAAVIRLWRCRTNHSFDTYKPERAAEARRRKYSKLGFTEIKS